MSGKVFLGAVTGILVGAACGYSVAISQISIAKAEVEEAKSYQVEFAEENSELTIKNISMERRMREMENSTYDRHKIRECMLVSSILRNAISARLTDQPLSSVESGMLTLHMSAALVAVQGKSRQAAMSTLIEDRTRIDEECLDQARIKVDPLATLVQ